MGYCWYHEMRHSSEHNTILILLITINELAGSASMVSLIFVSIVEFLKLVVIKVFIFSPVRSLYSPNPRTVILIYELREEEEGGAVIYLQKKVNLPKLFWQIMSLPFFVPPGFPVLQSAFAVFSNVIKVLWIVLLAWTLVSMQLSCWKSTFSKVEDIFLLPSSLSTFLFTIL